MTKPPCFDTTTNTDCPRRSPRCRATCPEWKEWETVHAEEKREIKRKKDQANEIAAFQAGLWKRRQNLADDRFWKERG